MRSDATRDARSGRLARGTGLQLCGQLSDRKTCAVLQREPGPGQELKIPIEAKFTLSASCSAFHWALADPPFPVISQHTEQTDLLVECVTHLQSKLAKQSKKGSKTEIDHKKMWRKGGTNQLSGLEEHVGGH